ncbi:hypothetical protein EC919_102397 [Pseudomonas graminis]|nr:hypothetical protein EC919_102397 [Pseudomonas graminis]
MTGTAIDEATPVMGRFICLSESNQLPIRAAHGRDAERLKRHSHAERGNDQPSRRKNSLLCLAYSRLKPVLQKHRVHP